MRRYLRVLGDPGEHTMHLQRYLSGPLTEVQRFRLICRAGVLLTAERRGKMGRTKSAQCTMCEAGVRETLNHALLQCARFAAERQTMWAAGLEQVVGAQRVAQARALPEDHCSSWRP